MEKNIFRETFEKEIKPLIRPFILLFLLSFFIINWEDVIWIFNKEALMQALSDRAKNMTQELSGEFSSIPKNGQEDASSTLVYGNFIFRDGQYFPIENSATGSKQTSGGVPSGKVFLEIPAMDLKKEIIFPETNSPKEINESLMATVMHYPGSALPGNEGNAVLLAHSAPISWPPSYRVFNKLDKLLPGQRVYIHYGDKLLNYEISKNYLINPGDQLRAALPGEKNIFLLTCWPPNTGAQRMVAEGFLLE